MKKALKVISLMLVAVLMVMSVGLNVLHALEAKACDVTWERDRRKVWYVLFSISGFSDELRNHAATRDDLLLIDDRGR